MAVVPTSDTTLGAVIREILHGQGESGEHLLARFTNYALSALDQLGYAAPSATKERVTTAFKIILSDVNVEGILVNIFGGIMRCDVIAEGVVAAAREISLNVPLVVRLEGTNVDLGKKIMKDSGLPIITADNLADAAEKVVKAVKEAA